MNNAFFKELYWGGPVLTWPGVEEGPMQIPDMKVIHASTWGQPSVDPHFGNRITIKASTRYSCGKVGVGPPKTNVGWWVEANKVVAVPCYS